MKKWVGVLGAWELRSLGEWGAHAWDGGVGYGAQVVIGRDRMGSRSKMGWRPEGPARLCEKLFSLSPASKKEEYWCWYFIIVFITSTPSLHATFCLQYPVVLLLDSWLVALRAT